MKPLSRGDGWVAGQMALVLLQLSLPLWWGRVGLPAVTWGEPLVGWEPILGLALAVVGVGLAAAAVISLGDNLTAVPQPKDDSVLVTRGPYRWVRHPIYSAFVVLFLGWAVVWKDPVLLGLDISLFVLFTFKSRLEERWLVNRYPEYPAYMQRTGGLIPRIRQK